MSEQREREFEMPDVANLAEPEPPEMEKQILVAGVGNAWLGDDGFGGHVVNRLLEIGVPPGVQVQDFGSGGLDLAYEVMRGYHAMVLVDVSEQGGEPGDVYVLEPDPGDIKPIQDGETISPHGMDPQSVLRFVKTVHGWPGKVVVVGCEPADVENIALELSEPVKAAVDRAAAVVLEELNKLQSDAAYGPS
jgi:hydrogenase maturation protease